MRALVCLMLLAVPASAVVPAVAHAQPGPTDKTKTAKRYVDAGLAAQNSGDYDTAIQLYTKAYELVPHPVLLFNMAQAHRLAGHIPQALALYARYLAAAPNGAQAKTARDLVAEIEAVQAEEARKLDDARKAEVARKAEQARIAEEARHAEAARKLEASRKAEQARQDRERESGVSAPPATVSPVGTSQVTGTSEHTDPAPGRNARLAGIAVGAAGGVSLVIGIGFAVHGQSLSAEVEKQYDPAKVDAGHRANTVAAVGLAGGTLLVAGGAALYWWGYQQGRGAERLAIAPLVSDRVAGLVLSGSL